MGVSGVLTDFSESFRGYQTVPVGSSGLKGCSRESQGLFRGFRAPGGFREAQRRFKKSKGPQSIYGVSMESQKLSRESQGRSRRSQRNFTGFRMFKGVFGRI